MAMPGYGVYDTEAQDIEQRRRYAEALRQQGIQPIETNRMMGRVAIRTSPLEGLAKMLQAYSGQRGVREAGEEAKALATRADTERGADMSAIVNALRGTPARPQQMGADDMAMIADQGGESAPMIPAAPGDPNAAAMAALQSKFSDVRGMAPGLMNIAETRQNRAEDRAFREQQAQAAREARAAELQLRLQDQRLAAQDRAALQRELAQLQIQSRADLAKFTAANRPEKLITVMDPNGNAITVPQSQVGGMPIYNPQAAKQIQDTKKKVEAKEQLTGTVAQLKGYYDALKEGGGIVEQGQGTLGNISSRIQSSAVGQMAGGAVGTKNQEMRQKIEQTRPLLLNLIKNATGMSAQQMNSNAEMQLYLRAATDPTLSYEANVEALGNLDKLFGLGLGLDKPAATGAGTPPASDGGWAVVR